MQFLHDAVIGVWRCIIEITAIKSRVQCLPTSHNIIGYLMKACHSARFISHLLRMMSFTIHVALTLLLTMCQSENVFGRFLRKGVHPWHQEEKYNSEGRPGAQPSVEASMTNAMKPTKHTVSPTLVPPSVSPPEKEIIGEDASKVGRAVDDDRLSEDKLTTHTVSPTLLSPSVSPPKKEIIGEDASKIGCAVDDDCSSEDTSGTLCRSRCSKKNKEHCCKKSPEKRGSITYIHWLNAARDYEKCASMKIPHSCRPVGEELRCSIPLEGEVYPIIRLMSIHGLKFKIRLVDRGYYGMYFDIAMKERAIDELIDLFAHNSIMDLAQNLTEYEMNISNMHQEYFQKMTGKRAPKGDKQFTHPAESLYKFIARIKYLNPMETDEIILRNPNSEESADDDIAMSTERVEKILTDE